MAKTKSRDSWKCLLTQIWTNGSEDDGVRWFVLRSDPRVIPVLVNLVKTKSDHYVIGSAIRDLSEFKCKAAVEGLIECFDVKFKSEDVGMGEHVTPATYYNLIRQSPTDHRAAIWRRQAAVAPLVREKGRQDANLK